MYTVSQGKHSKSSPGVSPTAATSQSSCDFPCGAGCTRGAPGSQMRTKITCLLLFIPSPLRKAMYLLFFFLTTLMKLPGALYSIKPNARSESTREFLMGSRALPCLLSSRPAVHADSALLLKSNRLPGLTRPEAPFLPSLPKPRLPRHLQHPCRCSGHPRGTPHPLLPLGPSVPWDVTAAEPGRAGALTPTAVSPPCSAPPGSPLSLRTPTSPS